LPETARRASESLDLAGSSSLTESALTIDTAVGSRSLELFFECGHHRDDHVDLCTHVGDELERGNPPATLAGEERAA
jgi:hypothetical protein